MLLPRIPFVPGALKMLVRSVSSSSSELPYHPKVRACPFVISRDEAVNRMAVLATACCTRERLFSSFGAYFFPRLGFRPFQPRQIQRVYVPVWYFDAGVEINVTRVNSRRQRVERATFTLKNAHMPGLVFDPLHRISFNDQSVFPEGTVPFSQSLLEHEGSEVLCPPYTISPLALPDFIRSLSPKQTVSTGYRIDPLTLETSFLAAYPVLMPIYLAHYHVDTPDDSFPELIFALEAHRKDGRIFTRKVRDRLYETFKWYGLSTAFSPPDVPRHEFAPMATPFRIEPPSPFVRPTVWGVHSADLMDQVALSQHINNLLSMKQTMTKYEHFVKGTVTKPMDFDDLRVREFTENERRDNRGYLLAINYIQLAKHLAGDIDVKSLGVDEVRFTGLDKFRNKKSRSSDKTGQNLQDFQNSANKYKPAWLKQWEAQQELSQSKNTKHAKSPKSKPA